MLVAPGSFKGSLRAAQVAGAIGRGLERAGLMPPDLMPLADGGEGTLEALLVNLGGETAAAGDAGYGLLEDGGTAVIEMAAQGTGELIADAVDRGAAVIVLAAGGWAPAAVLDAIEEGGRLRGARLVVLGDPKEPGPSWILDVLGFDTRMRAARAVVTGEGRLDDQTLRGRLVGEIGTRTRQAGVPLHAIVGRDELDLFGKRMIDLQVVREAATLEEIEAAGQDLGRRLATGQA